jgi:hypothetical protein
VEPLSQPSARAGSASRSIYQRTGATLCVAIIIALNNAVDQCTDVERYLRRLEYLCVQLDRAADQQLQHQRHVRRYRSFSGRHWPNSALVIFFRYRDAIQLGVGAVGSDFGSW